MKIRILLIAVFALFTTTLSLSADESKTHPKEETELEGKMDTMAGAWRKVKRQVADASKNAESLELVATIRTAAEEAAKLTPAMAADVPAGDRAKFVADYQAGIKRLVVELGKLEAALKAGNNDEAAKLVADIGALQKAGHKQFKRPDEKK
jgi:soluble cytochrome b562